MKKFMTMKMKKEEDVEAHLQNVMRLKRHVKKQSEKQCSQTRTFMKYRRRSHSFKLLKCQFMFTMLKSFVYESIFEYSNMSSSKKGDHTKHHFLFTQSELTEPNRAESNNHAAFIVAIYEFYCL